MGIISRVQTEKELMLLKKTVMRRDNAGLITAAPSFMTGRLLPPSLEDSQINRRLMENATAKRALALTQLRLLLL